MTSKSKVSFNTLLLSLYHYSCRWPSWTAAKNINSRPMKRRRCVFFLFFSCSFPLCQCRLSVHLDVKLMLLMIAHCAIVGLVQSHSPCTYHLTLSLLEVLSITGQGKTQLTKLRHGWAYLPAAWSVQGCACTHSGYLAFGPIKDTLMLEGTEIHVHATCVGYRRLMMMSWSLCKYPAGFFYWPDLFDWVLAMNKTGLIWSCRTISNCIHMQFGFA